METLIKTGLHSGLQVKNKGKKTHIEIFSADSRKPKG
jgi:hypothetical protein